ncbi:MAG: alpha-galactosidase [Ruminococcaceae bacterium]|nr:alpha-galactosidase [Oscillospiraceae bacterium]
MSIIYNESTRTFNITAGDSSLCIGVMPCEYLATFHYGKKIPDTDFSSYVVYATRAASFNPSRNGGADCFTMDTYPLEYPSFGTGDYRRTGIRIRAAEGNTATDFRYSSHRIYKGKPSIPGLPATYANSEDEADTLEITMTDSVTGGELCLVYTAFKDINVITKSAHIKNCGAKPFVIEDICSSVTNLSSSDFSMINLYGKHNNERNFSKNPISHNRQSIISRRGASGHEQNPFIALVREGSTEESGDAYGFNFVYSGSYEMGCDVDYYDSTRITVGFNPEQFSWLLSPGEEFYTPETVHVYTDRGLGEMSRIFHRFYSNNLIRGRYKTEKRPLLINSWEAAYFDFDEEKLVSFAREAKDLGIEMLVMDDGWFGHRDNDRSSLGDWFVYESKINLQSLVRRVHDIGLKFGIWYEPEMISEDSLLYRAHPDWCLHVEGREHCECRHQLVLDMSRPEVVDNIFEQMCSVLSSCEIDYLKWDFNRNLTEVGSATLPPERHGELYHRFMLGTYDLMDRITSTYPHILLENCAGGGGRFDPGMLYYSPQIWTSDNTDPIERLAIQFGTSLCYPASAMGAHVSFCPRTGFDVKGDVALWGTFGYELDPTRLSESDKALIKEQIADYHKYYDLIRYGDLYRLISPWDGERRVAWEIVSPDRSKVLITTVSTRYVTMERYFLKLRGLDPEKTYRSSIDGKIFSGAFLMYSGLNLTFMPCGDKQSYKVYIEEV